jgi:hypothetical protein
VGRPLSMVSLGVQMSEHFQSGLPRMQLRIFQFNRIFQKHLGRLHGHMKV